MVIIVTGWQELLWPCWLVPSTLPHQASSHSTGSLGDNSWKGRKPRRDTSCSLFLLYTRFVSSVPDSSFKGHRQKPEGSYAEVKLSRSISITKDIKSSKNVYIYLRVQNCILNFLLMFSALQTALLLTGKGPSV